jgi:hypothetical protein
MIRRMDTLLANAGKAFLKAALASFLVVVYGLASQPTIHGALAIGIAALMAAVAAGLAAIQTFIPQLTFAPYLPAPWGSILDSFIRAALGAFVVSLIGILQEPSMSGWHAAFIAAVIGAINAGLQAIQGTLTLDYYPAPRYGITLPPKPLTKYNQPEPAASGSRVRAET